MHLFYFVTLLFLRTCLCGNFHGSNQLAEDPAISWEEKWFDNMPIDHFSHSDQRTFSMRYLINTTHWDNKGGPIFFYCGNEGKIDLFAKNTGFVWDIAPEFKAMVVFAEHRYYGKTMPFGNDSYSSIENLGKLSSEQTLADFAVFLTWLKQNISGADNSPVVAFGGSYGGMLAAWFRIKYPHIVVGSLASSAPILQFQGYTPCWTFSSIVTRTFAESGPACDQVVKKSWPAIRKLAETDSGRKTLNSAFNLCPNSSITDADGATGLVNFINSAFSYMAMIDYPYPTNFLNPVPGWPVQEACKFMSKADATNEELVAQVAKGVGVYANYTGQRSCYVMDGAGGTTSDLGTDGWYFQTCTEMVMPMCQNGTDMFEVSPWNFTEFSNECARKFFGVRPRRDWAMTNYGGDHLKYASNIIFSHGLLDPWNGGGWYPPGGQASAFPTLVSLKVRRGAHHYDLRGRHPKDTEEIRKIRRIERKWILHWIQTEKHVCIMFSNGHLDPWSGGSVVETVAGSDGSLVVVNIPMSAHHLDLRFANANDTSYIIEARNKYKEIFKSWIETGMPPVTTTAKPNSGVRLAIGANYIRATYLLIFLALMYS